MAKQRERIRVRGIVQGVGFRPFVYRIALDCNLTGFVLNDGEGVLVEVEGTDRDRETFRSLLVTDAPPLSRIVSCEWKAIPSAGSADFRILESREEDAADTLISPDVSLCDDCRRELFERSDRRYRYPFINCTHCGPRYTIVASIPYDRRNTSMKRFPMCDGCLREYLDPRDRRFHAQPNACPNCGPSLLFIDRDGKPLAAREAALEKALEQLEEGRILAIRGLGGFHLAADPRNDRAIRELRRRKGRAEKPFALMMRDTATVRRYVELPEQDRQALEQRSRPIVLLRSRPDHDLSPAVAPNNRKLGVMLPYTPLHELLLAGPMDALVMTSGNLSEEPIATGNQEAARRLQHLADGFLLHDREILQRCDDSIVRVVDGKERMIRRARGYAPSPVFLPQAVHAPILACGGELKNTVALVRGDQAFLSQHIGDLDNPSALAFFEHTIGHLGRILRIRPERLAYDLHPEYLSTKWARERSGLPGLAVQHHHAHLASVMAENGVTTPTLGLILDGTGYGIDRTIWGGEILAGDYTGFRREAWLETVPMPGGNAAIRQPWRMAFAWLQAAFGDEMPELPAARYWEGGKAGLLAQAVRRRINAPVTSSCGRLFDAVASILDLRHEIDFEAQAAIDLETAAEAGLEKGDAVPHLGRLPEPAGPARLDPAPGSGAGPIPVTPLIRNITRAFLDGADPAVLAAWFHAELARILTRSVIAAAERTGIRQVGLSGGVFQNALLLARSRAGLEEAGLTVLTHSILPCGDGGISLGQAMIADVQWGRPDGSE